MGTAYVEFDISETVEYLKQLGLAAKDIKNEMTGYVNGDMAAAFINLVQEILIERDIKITGNLINSIGDIRELSNGGLTVEIGTRLEYAAWVNDGHEQTRGRFIPGVWKGKKFEYIPGAKTGMILKADHVEGKKFWEDALAKLEQQQPELAEKWMERVIEKYGL